MASENTTNGTSSSTDNGSAAQKLMAKHAAHNVEIEEVVDEEDIAHPPPSTTEKPSTTESSELPATTTMSDVAKGKQKADMATPAPKPRGPAFDVRSEESFPSLGGPTFRATAPPAAWAQGNTNGIKAAVNGKATSKPAPSPSAQGPISLPGRHVESITLSPQHIANRQSLNKPVGEVLRDINKRSKARLTSRAGPNGDIIFEGTGPVEAVRQALKELVQTIGSKVRNLVSIKVST